MKKFIGVDRHVMLPSMKIDISEDFTLDCIAYS